MKIIRILETLDRMIMSSDEIEKQRMKLIHIAAYIDENQSSVLYDVSETLITIRIILEEGSETLKAIVDTIEI